MVLLRFTKLINKVRSGEKRQTIRLPRKYPIKIGDTLQVYVIEKLGEARVTSIERKQLQFLSDKDGLRDGFGSGAECRVLIQQMHEDCDYETEFDIITFDPEWLGE